MNSCANSNIGTKLRGTKSSESREELSSRNSNISENDTDNLGESDKSVKNATPDTVSSSNEFGVRKGTLVICQKDSGGHNFARIKQKNSCGGNRNEVRMARGTNNIEQRCRGRGGRPYKRGQNRGDGNAEQGYHSATRQKFQESLKNQDNGSNKYYDDKRINDESRITKLMRRLCREDDYDDFMLLVKQVQEAIATPDNYRIIKRNLEAMCEILYDVLHIELPKDARQQTAKCLSQIGYAIIPDFKRFLEWIFAKYTVERKDDLKCILMKSIGDILKMDIESQKLKDYSMAIMSRLQSTLENVDRPDLLMATVDAILIATDQYPETFSDHFRDAVDILVGWHIDFTQPKSVIAYASKSLQRLHDFWIADLQFTLILLSQFLEDMESYDEELSLTHSGRSSPGEEPPPGPKECILRITSLISVFNTVTRSVGNSLNPTVTPAVQWSFLTECLTKMLQTVVKAIELNEEALEQLEATEDDNYLEDEARENERINHLSESMKGLTLSQRNMDSLVKKVSEDNVNDQQHFFKIIKSMSSGRRKDDKKNAKVSGDRENEIEGNKLKILLKLLKTIDEKNKEKNKAALDLSQEKEDLIVAANQGIFQFLNLLQSRIPKNYELLYKFLDIQLKKIDIFLDDTVVSSLNTISKIIKEVSANLPLELVHKLLGSESLFLKVRFRHSIEVQNASLIVYHSLLGLKNIPLLQEAYRYILSDLENAYKLIMPNFEGLIASNPLSEVNYNQKDAETIIFFLLRALSDLANASNSIIGMWALKPTILELLAIKMQPYDASLAKSSPLLQHCILFLLYAHCSRYNHFVPSSSLITGPSRPIDIFPGALDVPTASPTSGHLSTILNLIYTCFDLKETPENTILLLCNWMQEICTQAETYFNILKDKEDFKMVVGSLLSRAATTNPKIALAICKSLEILVNDKKIIWPELIYLRMIDLSIVHSTSLDTIVRERYGALLIRMPINIVIPRTNRQYLQSETKKLKAIENYSIESVMVAQRLHMRGNLITSSSTSTASNGIGEMQAQHFKTFMAVLLHDHDFDAQGLTEIFTLCWPTISETETMLKMDQFGLTSRSFLFFWCGMEAAQHCVLNKLRTPLGKPQETFTSIEGALKSLAREISCKPEAVTKNDRGLDYSLHEHTRVRLFVEFLEHLERAIHNAAEGCAVALAPLPKPVRTFFHTNKSTCKEWLIRIRLALCVVALHAGLATNALRNGQRLLEDLVDVKVTHRAEFERATLCTAQALVMLGETETLQGLYFYTKERERKFPWLKAAAEEAAGRYENAAESYKAILREHPCTKIQEAEDENNPEETPIDGDIHVAAFAMQHLTRCYMAVGDWTQLESWKMYESDILSRESNGILSKQIWGSVVSQQATCLKNFETGQTNSLAELSDWTLLDEKANTNWSCTKTMVECSNTLFNIALRIDSGEEDDEKFVKNKVALCKKVAGKIIEEGLRNMPSVYLTDAILAQYSAQGLSDLLENKKTNNFDLITSDKIKNLGCNTMGQILWWSDYFSSNSASNSSTNVSSLRLDLIKSARKEGNFKLAKREMIKYFCNESLLGFKANAMGTAVESMFSEITQSILKKPVVIKWTQNNMRAFREMAKLLYGMESFEDAVKVCSVTALGISRSIVNGDEPSDNLRETGTRLMLTLGKWIQQQEKNVSENSQLNELLRFEAIHNDGLMSKLFGQTTELIPNLDMIIGKLMQLGVNQCPELAAAWADLAGWCYKWGRKIIDNSYLGQLTETDVTNIRALLPPDTPEADSNAILAILSQNKSIPEDEGDIETNDIKTSDMIEHQLRQVPILAHATNEHLNLLVDIWRQAQKRIYSYYELSANAYFKYLELADSDANHCATITATLRLLRLVVKHALELQHVLESGLSTTPTEPWKEIIPQLFSRLTHPESYVRTRVSELLCRVAENSPHLITFPAVVGASSNHGKDFEDIPARYDKPEILANDFDFDVDDVEPPTSNGNEDEGNDDDHKTFMDACFAQLAECLANGIQDSVNHVKILVKELRRITLLWDELWLATFFQHHGEISKRFEQLELEIQKVQDNMWLTNDEKDKLIVEKHRIILKPIVFILENLLAMTSVPAETPHERQFQEKFGPTIEEVIKRLKNPKNPAKPQLASASLKQLEAKLAQRVNKRGPYTLSMADISPILANMKDTKIAMPGVLAVDRNKIVTIRSVDNNVQILPTKTKPKKLMFHGSDGHVYTYLFKGLEDLHLDERIMQFLTICNTMMSKNSDTSRTYRARHYSVIPLGPRSGLIQWVDGVTPLFALYKRWQQRTSAMAGTKGSTGTSTVMRPSELFYNKLAPLLKERGIPLENRKEWPLPVLKQVLSELMAETPKDLLAKEIWCNSINACNWWQATKSYSYSVAVMSIIGYIIGLGDRHLDNVLVDLNTGEVVHIDYNVCFEKGKTLRVPEKVPFRMTPNIKTALGVTGVEGIFRSACEHTLRVMRRGRETLLTLLEAFVYDPLVDWKAGAENSIATYGACQARARCTGVGRKQLEKELTRAMFAVRTAEMKAEWFANRDTMLRSLPMLSMQLGEWLETHEATRQCQDLLQDRHQQLGLIKEAQAIGRNHALYSVIKRYNTFKRARDAHENAKVCLKEKMEECEKQISMHNMALSTVRGPQLARWLTEAGTETTHEDHMVFDLVKEFLQNAGQNQMIVQCEQSENELTQLATQEALLIRSSVDLLSQYTAICSFYPMSTMAQHRSVMYHAWLTNTLNSGTVEVCHDAMAQFDINYEALITNDARIQKILTFSYQIQGIMNETNEKLKKNYEKMVANEGLPDAQARVEKTYNDIRLQISNFLRREKVGNKALESVNITALCALNKRYLMMEGAAKCAGECLMDLTSREGDWFLDEMRLLSSLIVELVGLIPMNSIEDFSMSRSLDCLTSADEIYKGLQELNYNFQMIILPEALKTIVTEEASVIMMVNEVDEIILSTGIPLVDILTQLEMHLRFTLMDMESPHAIVQSIVTNVRLRFEALLSRPTELGQDSETLSAGQMLLMGFNGLFEKLQIEGNALITTLGSLDIPTCWKKIDQIREAKEIAAPIFHEGARRVLDDIFLIKRLQTIREFFTMCREIGNTFKGSDGPMTIYDDDRLNKPVKSFTADYVSRQLLGVTSQTLAIVLCFLLQRVGLNVTEEIEQRDIGAESKVSLDELCRKNVDICLKSGILNGSVLNQASALCTSLEGVWRRKQGARVAQQSIEISRAALQRLQILFTAHQWLHEDSFLARSTLSTMNPLNRPNFMLELRKTASALTNIQARVCDAREQQQNLVASVDQRLKWAAGANPALAEVMAAFGNAVLSSNEKLSHQRTLAITVASTCNSILHYEALRTKTSESITNDANFVKLMKQWEESCILRSNLSVNVSSIEESLVELLQLENNIDAHWLRRAEKLISDAIVDNQKSLQMKQELHIMAEARLREELCELQKTLAEHHRLMTDIRVLLRTMLKQENIPGLQEFLTEYRGFMESISSVVKDLETENLEQLRIIEAKVVLDSLAAKVSCLYEELFEFAGNSCRRAQSGDGGSGVKKKAKLMRQDTNVCLSPRKGIPMVRDPTTGKAVQERNAYALNVWRRVRMKLEGRDPNPLRKCTTAEQVEYVIREAQNIDNLALLYEGWTPWV